MVHPPAVALPSASPARSRRDDGTSEPTAWVVRAGTDGEMVSHNLANDVVSVDWDDWAAPDLSRFADQDGYRSYSEEHFQHRTDENPQTSANQIWHFYHDISVGDIVVMPLKNHGPPRDWIAIGRVTGDVEHDPDAAAHAKHRRAVEWLAQAVSKIDAEGDLQSSIDSRGTLFRIDQPHVVQRLLSLAEDGFDPGPCGIGALHLPGEAAGVLDADGNVIEGASKRVSVLRYETDPRARASCIAAHGTTCQVCGIEFGAVYGDFADGYIHVHHKTPVHQAAAHGEYELVPEKDLIPVCPNCHAMLHRHPDKPCSVKELRRLIGEAAQA